MPNKYRLDGLIVAVILILVSALMMISRREMFSDQPVADNEVIPQKNETDDVWNRHSIQDSIPVDLVVQYPNVYYSELDNKSFVDAMNATFQPNRLFMNGAEWTNPIIVDKGHIPPADLVSSYSLIVPWIKDRLNKSTAFNLPGDDPAPFQIIHDHWNTWRKNVMMTNRYLYDLDVIIYREAKNHAKHMNIQIVMDGNKVVGVSELSLKGTIIEDRFGLFPVVKADKTDLDNQQMPFDANPLASYPPLINEYDVASEIARREADNLHVQKLKAMLERQPSPIS